MRDIIYLGPCPCNEEASQINDPYFREKNIAECKRYIDLLTWRFGPPPEGSSFKIKSEEHDYGIYREVVVSFDDAFPDSITYAFEVEKQSPNVWDDQSKYDWRNKVWG